MNTKDIAQMEVKYGDTGNGYVTMRARRQEDGTHQIHITDAFMVVENGDEVKEIISDFKRRLTDKAEVVKVEKAKKVEKPKKVAKPKKTTNQTYHVWSEEDKADAVRRYSAGEDIEQIAKDYGSTRASVLKLMQRLKVYRPGYGPRNRTKKEESPAVPKEPTKKHITIEVKKKVYRHWTPEEKKEVVRRYTSGESVGAIALDYGVTSLAIGQMCRKLGAKRPEGGTVRVPPTPKPIAEPTNDAIPEPVPPVNVDDEADKQRRAELKAYRESHKKPYYLN